ncbi:hypothetical protein COT77_02890 [Candidatus Berkelbacteria bacterium CG10_big_fil_rev_8_21_14_0_10_41_12]|uniref:Uncharacterized protein n=1 Tax=Candidatus Berkelbacteria bacterium CG10_big_fil_rev_8_21_14_0_10_41_12 TaxID=1974513 RepID=A0A2M6WWM4_9BACT|nr:MAG: hypothetical protein COT77_02890 [Candidatus Berkelbacteria bacterium CG10_big_fil_rev_8_21_14_0_10_41_12]
MSASAKLKLAKRRHRVFTHRSRDQKCIARYVWKQSFGHSCPAFCESKGLRVNKKILARNSGDFL